MPPLLGYIGSRNSNMHRIVEFRWPIGRELPSTIRKLSMNEFCSALELAANIVDSMKDDMNPISIKTNNVDTDVRSEYIDAINKLTDQNNELREKYNKLADSLLSKLDNISGNLAIYANGNSTSNPVSHNDTHETPGDVDTIKQLQITQNESLPKKSNKWRDYVTHISKSEGLSFKDAMLRAKETYHKDT